MKVLSLEDNSLKDILGNGSGIDIVLPKKSGEYKEEYIRNLSNEEIQEMHERNYDGLNDIPLNIKYLPE